MLAGMGSIVGFVSSTSSGGGTGGSFAVDVAPTNLTKTSGSKAAAKTLTTAPATASASGGAGGYTYAWARVSGSTGIGANSPTAAATTFSATLSPGQSVEANFHCTVTDASGTVIVSAEVTVTITLADTSVDTSL